MAQPVILPVHLNWCTFEIQALDESTPKDPDFREAQSYRKVAPYTVKGQLVGARGFDRTLRTATGDGLPTDGSAVFRYKELEQAGYTPKKGDLITKMFIDGPNPRCPIKGRTSFECRYRIIQAAPFSPLRRQFLLHKIVFEQDRKIRESV